jgi:hypothetical protein
VDRKVELRVSMLGYDDYALQIDSGSGKAHTTPSIALAESEKGQMAVQSKPEGAQVYVNDQKQACVTPCRVVGLELDRAHLIKVVLEGKAPYERKHEFPKDQKVVTIDAILDGAPPTEPGMAAEGMTEAPRTTERPAPRETTRREPAPEPRRREVSRPTGACAKPGMGMLIANSQPYARVFVDGRSTGRTTPIPPAAPLYLKPGGHKVEFVTSGGKKHPFSVSITACETTKLIRTLGN